MIGFRSIFSWAALYSKQIALVDIAAEFDRDFYLASYPDIAAAGVDPLQHFMKTGWKERRDPAASFSTGFYLEILSVGGVGACGIQGAVARGHPTWAIADCQLADNLAVESEAGQFNLVAKYHGHVGGDRKAL